MVTGDKSITCRECGAQFMFTASEQQFFASKGFTNEPGRCPDCRAARKARDGGYSGGYRSGGGYGRAEREMFTIKCAQCNKDAQVPFEPRLDKPVYCSDCFESRRSSAPRSGQGGGGGGGGGRGGRW